MRPERRSAFRPWHMLVNVLAASPFLLGHQRMRLYRAGGIDPNGTAIRPRCRFSTDKVTFGTGGMVNEGCWFENRERIDIGPGCFFGPDVLIMTSTHDIADAARRAGDYNGAPVIIGAGCWIGGRSTILPGATIGSGCVIAAGAVVASDCDPDGLYGGVPARRIRDL